MFLYDLYVAKLHLDFLFEEIQMRPENKCIVGKNCKCSFVNSPYTYDDKTQRISPMSNHLCAQCQTDVWTSMKCVQNCSYALA